MCLRREAPATPPVPAVADLHFAQVNVATDDDTVAALSRPDVG
jgi:hypothetical protein